MTPSKALFRSHLMQQFAAAARHQSRPPLALAAASSSSSSPNNSGAIRRSSSQSTSTFTGSSTTTRGSSSQYPPPPSALSNTTTTTATRTQSTLSDGVLLRNNDSKEDTEEDTVILAPSPLASSLQSLLTSRRTQSKFTLDITEQQQLHLKQALDRAIVCAQAAPNHHKTEPFFFKRMLAPSTFTKQLADIAAHIVLNKKLKKDPNHAQAHADRKRDKWNDMPAFLVALVQDNQAKEQQQDDDDDDEYEPMEYMPPTTERQLEDVSIEIFILYDCNLFSLQLTQYLSHS